MLDEYLRYFRLQAEVPQLAVEPDGLLQVGAGASQVILYDINGRVLAQLPVPGGDTAVRLPQMPPGRYFRFTDNGAAALLWTVHNP